MRPPANNPTPKYTPSTARLDPMNGRAWVAPRGRAPGRRWACIGFWGSGAGPGLELSEAVVATRRLVGKPLPAKAWVTSRELGLSNWGCRLSRRSDTTFGLKLSENVCRGHAFNTHDHTSTSKSHPARRPRAPPQVIPQGGVLGPSRSRTKHWRKSTRECGAPMQAAETQSPARNVRRQVCKRLGTVAHVLYASKALQTTQTITRPVETHSLREHSESNRRGPLPIRAWGGSHGRKSPTLWVGFGWSWGARWSYGR